MDDTAIKPIAIASRHRPWRHSLNWTCLGLLEQEKTHLLGARRTIKKTQTILTVAGNIGLSEDLDGNKYPKLSSLRLIYDIFSQHPRLGIHN